MSVIPDDFYRIQKLPPYVFAVINEMKAKARAANLDVVDLGMGNPDGPSRHRRREVSGGFAQPALFALQRNSASAAGDREALCQKLRCPIESGYRSDCHHGRQRCARASAV